MNEEISGRSEGQGRETRASGKEGLWRGGKNCHLKTVPNGEQYVRRPCETFQGSKKMSELDREKSENGHKMGLESIRGHDFLWAMVRNADFIPSEIWSH